MKTIELLSAAEIKANMSKGEWTKHIRAFCTVTTTGDNVVAACGNGSSNVDDLLPMQTANTYAIINSVNATYGQGYDPTVMPEMYNAMKEMQGIFYGGATKKEMDEMRILFDNLLKQCKI
jgi:hypothetical protein